MARTKASSADFPRDDVLTQYREAVAGAVIGIVLEAGNFLLFNHSSAGSELSLTIALVGVLLALQRSAMQILIIEKLDPVMKMTEFFDLQNDANVANIQGLLQRYLSITEPEFRALKEQVVSEATEHLRRLAIEKRSANLQTADYYDWIFRQFDTMKPGDYVHAVSLSSETEWNDSQLEKNFLAKNLDAVKRGVEVSRIFVINRDKLASFISLPPIQAHLVESGTGLRAYYVPREILERSDRGYLAAIGEGILDFNGHVGLEDRFDANGEVRGEVTMLPSDLARMLTTYNRLLNMALPLTGSLASEVN